jgi:transcriptional regulator with XRE-family HTH domain
MAQRVGIDRSFLADVERGKRNVSILNVDLMAKGLKVSLSQVVLAALGTTGLYVVGLNSRAEFHSQVCQSPVE